MCSSPHVGRNGLPLVVPTQKGKGTVFPREFSWLPQFIICVKRPQISSCPPHGNTVLCVGIQSHFWDCIPSDCDAVDNGVLGRTLELIYDATQTSPLLIHLSTSTNEDYMTPPLNCTLDAPLRALEQETWQRPDFGGGGAVGGGLGFSRSGSEPYFFGGSGPIPCKTKNNLTFRKP